MTAPRDYGPPGERPYQCFMGRWEGLCKTFSPAGDCLEATPVHMDVHWVEESTWHLHEHFENLYEVGDTTYHTDISVEGRRCVEEIRSCRREVCTHDGAHKTVLHPRYRGGRRLGVTHGLLEFTDNS